MAIPASRQAPTVGNVVSYAPGGVKSRLLLPQQPAPPPISQASFNAAADSAAYTVPAGQTVVVTFGNLPNRTPGVSPNSLQRQQGSIAVRSFDTLQFTVTAQNTSGDAPTVTPRTIDHSGARIAGSTLVGGNTYKQFQAVITAGKTACQGTVSGSLSLMVN